MRNKGTTRKLSIISLLLAIGLIFSCCFLMACENDTGETEKDYVFCTYEADLSEYNLDSRMVAAKEKMLNLLVSKGYPKSAVIREESNKLRVEVPGVENPETILNILDKSTEMKFVLSDSGKIILTGNDITNATVSTLDEKYCVQISFNVAGAAKFYEATSENIGENLEIILSTDGKDETIFSAPIMSAISNAVVLTNIKSLEKAQQLANQINGGTYGIILSLVDFGTFKK